MRDLDDTIVINSAPQGHTAAIVGVALGCLLMLFAWLMDMTAYRLLLMVFLSGAILLVGSMIWGAMRFYDRQPILVISPLDLTDNRQPESPTVAWSQMKEVRVVRELQDGQVANYDISYVVNGQRRRLDLKSLEYDPLTIFSLLEDKLPAVDAE